MTYAVLSFHIIQGKGPAQGIKLAQFRFQTLQFCDSLADFVCFHLKQFQHHPAWRFPAVPERQNFGDIAQ